MATHHDVLFCPDTGFAVAASKQRSRRFRPRAVKGLTGHFLRNFGYPSTFQVARGVPIMKQQLRNYLSNLTRFAHYSLLDTSETFRSAVPFDI